MIVLDTNALIGAAQGPSTSATMLRALAVETGHQLAIPQEVLDEYLAKLEREIRPLVEQGDSERILTRVPHWLSRSDVARGGAGATLPTVATVINERRESLTERPSTRFVVLSTPEGAADEGIGREKLRRPPATDGHEARDVVVWLTAMDAAKKVSPSNLYFVSSDKGFREKDSKSLRAELRAEAPPNLRFFPDVKSLIERLSCPSEPPAEVATKPEVLAAIEQTAIYGGHDPNHDLRRDLWGWLPEGARRSDISSVAVSLVSDPRIESRRCGDTTFTAVDAICRLQVQYRPEGSDPADLSVRLGVLTSHEDDDLRTARVLARGGIRPYEHQEDSNGVE